MKKPFPAEIFYIFGIVFVAFSVSFMEKGGYGLSTVVGPAYVLYRKLTLTWPIVSFGMMEYTFQGFLLIIMCLVIRRFRVSYLFSFVTAVVYGLTLNAVLALTAPIQPASLIGRIACYAFGLLIGSVGIACILHTYFAPEVYELIIKEIPRRFHLSLGKFKTGFDITFFITTILLSFLFFGFGKFVGVGIGTVVCALINGTLIASVSNWIDRHFKVIDWLPIRRYFEDTEPDSAN